MTPEVSAIVRELRERAPTSGTFASECLMMLIANEIEAGTFVPSCKVGDTWGSMTPEQRVAIPVGAIMRWEDGPYDRKTGTMVKTDADFWRQTATFERTGKCMASNNVIIYLPTKAVK